MKMWNNLGFTEKLIPNWMGGFIFFEVLSKDYEVS